MEAKIAEEEAKGKPAEEEKSGSESTEVVAPEVSSAEQTLTTEGDDSTSTLDEEAKVQLKTKRKE